MFVNDKKAILESLFSISRGAPWGMRSQSIDENNERLNLAGEVRLVKDKKLISASKGPYR